MNKHKSRPIDSENKGSQIKNKAIKLGIKGRMIVSIFILAVVTLFGLSLFAFGRSRAILVNSFSDTMVSRAEDNARIIGDYLGNIQGSMETMAMREVMVGMDWEEQYPVTLSEAKRLGIEQIQISEPNGLTRVKEISFNLADKPNFQLAMQGVTNITPPLYSEGDQKLIMIIATPIYKAPFSSDIVGILGGVMTAEEFGNIVNKIDVGGGYSFVLDGSGQVIAHKDIQYVKDCANFINQYDGQKGYEDFVRVQKDMLKGGSKFDSFSLDGEDMFVSYAPIPGTSWSLGCAIPQDEVLAPVRNLRSFMLLIAVVAIIGSLILLFVIAGTIVKPIRKLQEVTDELAKGNLDVNLDMNRSDEIGILARSLGALTDRLHGYKDYIAELSYLLGELGKGNLNLNFSLAYEGEFATLKSSLENTISMLGEMIKKLDQTARDVSESAESVADGSQALAQGATEQASSIEELSATINQITDQIQATAKNADDARASSERASSACDEGKVKMEEMVSAMNEISETSGQIGKIIKNIEDIAFQTNILALNAAVEAARAGAAGKGFSVVADEVRSLAAKSAESAKNTALLIQSSIDAVNNGTRVAEETVSSLEQVVAGTKETADLIESIATASAEEADSISQINIGVEQVSSVVQQNSETAERSAYATEDLIKNSNVLGDIISSFKL